ncbi:FtsW/RodA/SpoVE family cell cycle protein [Tenacibaculum piscium]|uniref:Probable peptidoglycan glycosyltransferase FtsW n=1 Tax=Tenacibaculum piscium TaxID=1458515 RepID=A0A2H1YJ84_9FLAO|nr:FtsW/RodA/SpoVE family cell cycle protein [Tenacibaculum piscium]MBE7628681.1 FtsW/RodA/SpoVE family cell cycle protein [Tenacibaculum piscium]MBE7669822.1 FtsW/RodA/SpoVE family cell cycle protein [Tenacibaculum piscium]MBE7689203.1 FtsW/RodA/SpoVE family cell cycle protein [Tenacibaculum piscium]MCG8182911.1 FtsW/RodA/SpoVE family cell cycle protein [Tenacibaculum piscium]MCG8204303.1 FtsW/RodA/SpoVE family cell cycle protein [Tenacibaculum piscium]
MKVIFQYIKGDKAIWAIVTILAIFSFMPIYSASTNLVYVVGNGSTIGHLIKHMVLLITGFGVIYGVHKVPYKYFSGMTIIMFPIVAILLVVTLAQGREIGGANASRWLNIPFVGIGFQTSTLAGLVLMVFVSSYLARNQHVKKNFKQSLVKLWLPVSIILLLVLPANFSTTAIIFLMVLLLTFIGGYPVKYLSYILGIGVFLLLFFVLITKAFPELMPNRVSTWKSRIEGFSKSNGTENYQVEKAKIAIVTGGMLGRGPGKSVQKNFLPQSSSDFIYAIIIEEYGLLGAVLVAFIYFFLLLRILVTAKKATTVFGTLLVIGVGVPIVFQAMINMAVAVNILPVTGQTLPLISSGGTSIWMTCFALGIILSVSASANEASKTLAVLEDELENEISGEMTGEMPTDIEENPLNKLDETNN